MFLCQTGVEGRAARREVDPMPATSVLVLHDDGQSYVAQLLGQHRDRATGGWRLGVLYSVDVGMQFQRVVLADQCKALPLRPQPSGRLRRSRRT
jgi:hypothetical protein